MIEYILWYVAITSIILFVFGVMCSVDGFINVALKVVLFLLAFFGVFIFVFLNGFIVHTEYLMDYFK